MVDARDVNRVEERHEIWSEHHEVIDTRRHVANVRRIFTPHPTIRLSGPGEMRLLQ